jgi:tetratricopeptide (TPR) repeat protein
MGSGFVRAGAAVATLAAVLGAARPQSPAARADQILDAYEARDFDAALALMHGEKSTAKLARAFQTRAGAWVAEAPPAQAAFRRRVAASAAIELVGERMNPDWDDVRELLEWGCQLLRQGAAPAEWERAWLLGSIALAERAHDYAMLLGDPSADVPAASPRSDPATRAMLQRVGVLDQAGQVASYLHIGHAIARFSDEPRFELAHIVMSDPQWVDVPAGSVWMSDDALKLAAAQSGSDAVHTEIARRYWLRTVAAAYVALADKAPALAAECRVRAGVAYWRLHQFDQAGAQFRRVSSGDREWRSLAAFWRGDLAERASDPAAAADFYREAIGADPASRAAASRLGALLFLDGRRAEADDVLSRSLLTPPHDPWRELAYGDFRHWPDYRRDLRAETLR